MNRKISKSEKAAAHALNSVKRAPPESAELEKCAVAIDKAVVSTIWSIVEIGKILLKAHALLAHHGSGTF